jgi:hypothetical protein
MLPRIGLVETLQEFVGLPLGYVFGDAVVVLNPADELFSLPIDNVQVVVGKLSPLFSDFSLVFFPRTLQSIPVHFIPPRS